MISVLTRACISGLLIGVLGLSLSGGPDQRSVALASELPSWMGPGSGSWIAQAPQAALIRVETLQQVIDQFSSSIQLYVKGNPLSEQEITQLLQILANRREAPRSPEGERRDESQGR